MLSLLLPRLTAVAEEVRVEVDILLNPAVASSLPPPTLAVSVALLTVEAASEFFPEPCEATVLREDAPVAG
ncbi:hypothetical protein D3C73_1502660 [compost metagenome]